MVLAGDPPDVDFGCGSYKEYLKMEQEHPEWFNDDYLEISDEFEDTPRFEKLPQRKKDGQIGGSDRRRSSRNGYKRARRNAEQARNET